MEMSHLLMVKMTPEILNMKLRTLKRTRLRLVVWRCWLKWRRGNWARNSRRPPDQPNRREKRTVSRHP